MGPSLRGRSGSAGSEPNLPRDPSTSAEPTVIPAGTGAPDPGKAPKDSSRSGTIGLVIFGGLLLALILFEYVKRR